MRLSKKQLGHLSILGATMLFAVNALVSKYLVSGHIYPLGLSAARILFGCIAFWLLSLFVKKERVLLKDHLIFIIGGITGYVFNFGCFTLGLSMSTSIDTSILITSTPLFTLFVAALILKEPITKMKIGGVLLGMLGAILIICSGKEAVELNGSRLLGNLIVLMSSLSFAFYLVLTKPIMSKYSSITIMKWMFLYATVLFLPFTFHYLWDAPLFSRPDPQTLLAFSYPLVACTLIAYLLIVVAQRNIRATTQSMYNNLQPVIVTILAVNMGMGQFTWIKALSAVLVLLGVYLVTQSKAKELK